MGRWLLGIDDPASTREGEQQPEKPEDLFTFDAGTPCAGRPQDSRAARSRPDRDARAAARRRSAPSTGPPRWEAARRLLLTSLKVRVGVDEPAARGARSPTRSGASRARGSRSSTRVVGRKATGEAIPVVRLIPTHPTGRLTVIADPRGKAAPGDGRGRADPRWSRRCWPRARASSASTRSSSASRSTRAIRCRIGPRPSTSRPTTRPWPPTRCRTWPPCSPGPRAGRRPRGQPGRPGLGRLSGPAGPPGARGAGADRDRAVRSAAATARPTSGRRRSTCPAWSNSAGSGPPRPCRPRTPLALAETPGNSTQRGPRAAYAIGGASGMLRIEDHSPAPDAIALGRSRRTIPSRGRRQRLERTFSR